MTDAASANAAALAIQGIRQVAINVHDPDRAVAFYRDILGLKLLFRAGHLAFFDCGGIRLMLSLPEQAQSGNSIIYFKVPNIQEAQRQMQSRGVQFEDEPHLIARMPDHDLWMTHFRDSEGTLLSMMSEVRLQKA